MPWWGIALALGPNINLDVDPAREKEAYDAVQRAVELAVRAPAKERAYVTALAKRYSNDPKADLKALAVDYKDAMRQLTRTYPNDNHALTLYAESMMDLRPWALYTSDGSPAEGTNEIVEVLERVLDREPDHVGANHYYIHATEASLTPERGMKSAKKLETLVPAAGHLVHMPSHTYMRTGNYMGALAANAKAAEVDRKYIAETNPTGFYPAMYYNHNLDFLASAAMMAGRYADALKAATEVTANVTPMVADMPMLEPVRGQDDVRADALREVERGARLAGAAGRRAHPDHALPLGTRCRARSARQRRRRREGSRGVPRGAAHHTGRHALQHEPRREHLRGRRGRARRAHRAGQG
ncbi:MAG: hypothetical protein QM731_29105 [Chitinophagaceae bacterium]